MAQPIVYFFLDQRLFSDVSCWENHQDEISILAEAQQKKKQKDKNNSQYCSSTLHTCIHNHWAKYLLLNPQYTQEIRDVKKTQTNFLSIYIYVLTIYFFFFITRCVTWVNTNFTQLILNSCPNSSIRVDDSTKCSINSLH